MLIIFGRNVLFDGFGEGYGMRPAEGEEEDVSARSHQRWRIAWSKGERTKPYLPYVQVVFGYDLC